MTNDVQNPVTPSANCEMPEIDTHTDPLPSKRTVVAMCVVWVGLLFVLARQSGWTLGSTYWGLFAAHGLVNIACILIWNPVLIERRMFSPIGKIWDVFIMVALMAMLIAMVVVANRDLNAREVNPIPLEMTWLTNLCLYVAGWVLITWSMVANPFFEKNVRIQTNHGHHVIDRGPYAYIRHPGYVGFSALFLSTPLLLASAWTFLPALIVVALLVIRTVFEDRMLQAELPGYRDYAERVRFRLIPGMW